MAHDDVRVLAESHVGQLEVVLLALRQSRVIANTHFPGPRCGSAVTNAVGSQEQLIQTALQGVVMADQDKEPMSWGVIIAITVAAGMVVGMLMGGVVGPMLGLSGGTNTAGVGVSIGIVGGLLLTRRNAALAKRDSSKSLPS